MVFAIARDVQCVASCGGGMRQQHRWWLSRRSLIDATMPANLPQQSPLGIWKTAYRACRTIRAPVLISRLCSEVSDHRSMSSDVWGMRDRIVSDQALKAISALTSRILVD